MTFPGGAPGGYPGQGPQQPQPGPGYGPPAAGGLKLGIPAISYLVVAGLGVLNLFLGFASLGGDARGVKLNFYEVGAGWVPGLLFIAGLTALLVILPGDAKPGPWPAIFTLGGALPFMFFVFASEGDLETGGVLIMIFGILQAIAAVVAYLFDVGIIKPPAPSQQIPYGQPGGYGPQSGGFPAPPQPGQFGQPAQPTQHYPQPQQPQPGQYGQPGPQPGQHPGTPPGGYPQQG